MAEQLVIPDPEWLTCGEVARHFRVSARTVLRWVDAGEFEAVRRLGPSGRTVRIHRTELDRARPAGRSAA
ncbi:helix-turn-helix domain-containing protein [Streptomyces griseoflavus]|uniref:helix-turn-helix domain-containing protein n=1 Tax=Streptomyces griseoflavus TaxID=35619 RepID=UPI003D75A311